jgi:hypothetical protein
MEKKTFQLYKSRFTLISKWRRIFFYSLSGYLYTRNLFVFFSCPDTWRCKYNNNNNKKKKK